ncbi:MAG TPA: hypothetical protein VI432_02555 [Candidatus Paceibacterota bacterium]
MLRKKGKLSHKQLRIRGQSLIEIIIGSVIGALVIGSAVSAVLLTIRSNHDNRVVGTASSLMQDTVDSVRAVAGGGWHDLYNQSPKGSGEQYSISVAVGNFVIQSGSENVEINGVVYTRYFTIENVCRDNSGRGSITGVTDSDGSSNGCASSGGLEDPSTQRITVKVDWPQGGELVNAGYLTRSDNKVTGFSDWSGEATDPPEVVTSPNNKYNTKDSNVDISNTGEIKLSD